MKQPSYPYFLKPAPEEDGGGYYVTIPALKGALADGETIEEALENAAEAEKAWLQSAKRWNIPIPPKPDPEDDF